MKFLSPNKVIKGFMKNVIFELGPERLYIWKKWRRKRELGKPVTWVMQVNWVKKMRISWGAVKILI